MSIISTCFRPFRFAYQQSNLLAPAREICEQAEDWTDYACAVVYFAFLIGFLYVLAVNISASFLLGAGALAAVVILAQLLWHYLR